MDAVGEALRDRLAHGEPAGRLARLLADLEDEFVRRERSDRELGEAVRSALDARSDGAVPKTASFLDRPRPAGLDRKANHPRSLRNPTQDEMSRGVAVAYKVKNFTVYRAIVDRLAAGELFRMETDKGAYEIPGDEFEQAFPGIAQSKSYRLGSDAAPGSARYVVGKPPAVARRYHVPV